MTEYSADTVERDVVLDAIGEALLAAYYVLEDGEDDGSGLISSPEANVKRLDKAFDVFEAWPDEPPYQCGPAAKAIWAIKCLSALTVEDAAKVSDEDRENIVDEIESIICETHEMDVRDMDYAENIVSWMEKHHPAALRAIAGTPKEGE